MTFWRYTTYRSTLFSRRAPADLSRLQAAAAGAQWPGADAAPLHGHAGEPARRQVAAPEDPSDALGLLWSVTGFCCGSADAVEEGGCQIQQTFIR